MNWYVTLYVFKTSVIDVIVVIKIKESDTSASQYTWCGILITLEAVIVMVIVSVTEGND